MGEEDLSVHTQGFQGFGSTTLALHRVRFLGFFHAEYVQVDRHLLDFVPTTAV